MTRELPGQAAMFDLPPDPAAAARKHVERVTAHHEAHALAGRGHPDCLTCQADPPRPKVIPHPFAELPTKFRTAAHLEFAHGDREMLPRLVFRQGAELTAYHKSLHDR